MAERLMQHDMWPPERPAFDGTVTRITSFTTMQMPIFKYVPVICMHSAHDEATSNEILAV